MNLGTVLAAAFGALVWVAALQTPAEAQSGAANAPLTEVKVAAGAFSLGEPVPSWVNPARVPDATVVQPIVFRLADTQFLASDTPVSYVHRALTVNDAASLTSAGQISISFAPQYQRLQLHSIRVKRGGEDQDRTGSAAIRFLQREVGLEQGFYSGLVTASVLMSDLRVGDTLEYAYSLHGQNPVFAGKFAEEAGWDQRFPTQYRRVILNSPVARPIAWRMIHDGEAAPVVPVETVEGGMRKVVFEVRDLPELAPEPQTPADYAAYRWLQFSEFSSWRDVVAWGSGLFQTPEPTDKNLRNLIEKLRAHPSDEERVVAALEFVQSEIRYYSVLLGESSHRPAAPELVLERRYGDCKDKSLLLMTLLKALDIPSRPVLLQVGRNRGLEKSLPSPQLFNHVIVQAIVDGKIHYLDPTRLGQHGRLSRMGQSHQGTQVLVIASDTLEPSVVSSAAPETLVSERSEVAKLPKLGGEARLEVRQLWNGVSAENLRVLLQHMPRERVVKSISDAMEHQYPGARIVGDPDLRDNRLDNVISLAAVYAVPKFATEREGNWIIRYLPSNMRGTLPTPDSAVRKNPLFLSALPHHSKYTFEVIFPNEVSIHVKPRKETFKSKYFTFAATSSFRGNRSKTTIDLQVLADRVEVRDMRNYADEVRNAHIAASGAVAIRKVRSKRQDP